MKRILLFLGTNLAIVALLGVVANALGVNRFLTGRGQNLGALRRLGGMGVGELPPSVASAGIAGRATWLALSACDPPIEKRIAALQTL